MKTKLNTSSTSKTGDVLGQPDAQPSVPGAWRHHHARLIQLRKHLSEEVDELEKSTQDESPSLGMDMEDAARDRFDRDLALTLLAMEHDAVGEIDAALLRIRNGRYGVCELTGKLIPRERLEAIPWTRYTVEAQSKLEQCGKVPGVRLNNLNSNEPDRREAK